MTTLSAVPSATRTAPAAQHADIAYEQIKTAIIQGSLAPGSRISEQQLAELLNVSRTPVHQAVVRLQSEEWLEISSRRGVTIAPLIASEMREIYEILIGLEGIAVTALASRPSDADDGIDEELRIACDKCETALEERDHKRWAEEDDRFHRLLIERCGNERLVRLSSSIVEQAHRARILTVKLRPWPTSSNNDHVHILECIANRNPEDARAALEAHRRRGIATLVPILEASNPTSDFQFKPVGR